MKATVEHSTFINVGTKVTVKHPPGWDGIRVISAVGFDRTYPGEEGFHFAFDDPEEGRIDGFTEDELKIVVEPNQIFQFKFNGVIFNFTGAQVIEASSEYEELDGTNAVAIDTHEYLEAIAYVVVEKDFNSPFATGELEEAIEDLTERNIVDLVEVV